MKPIDFRRYPAVFTFILQSYLIAVFLFLQGCNGFFQRGDDTRQTPLPMLKRIAILPMDRASAEPNLKRSECLLSGLSPEAYGIEPEASGDITRLLFQNFQDDQRFLIVSEGRCIGLLNSQLASDIKASKLRLIQAFGEELEVDAVLYSQLFRFEDRIGTKYSVERPASVAFTLQLIKVSDGATLWRHKFDQTQKGLMENLLEAGLYKKVGLRWLTAIQLADHGLNYAADELKKLLP
jgi:hypothetical protein